MRIAGLIKNDVVNGYDVCVSVWTQGCPFRCKECHNPQTWDFEGGENVDEADFIEEVCNLIIKNDIQRNLSILGGEPLCEQNLPFVNRLVRTVKAAFPTIMVFIWTGYIWEELNIEQMGCVVKADVLIDGRYDLNKRDITLPYRGSNNQRVIGIQKTLKTKEIVLFK